MYPVQHPSGERTIGVVEEREGDGADEVFLGCEVGREVLPAGLVGGKAEQEQQPVDRDFWVDAHLKVVGLDDTHKVGSSEVPDFGATSRWGQGEGRGALQSGGLCRGERDRTERLVLGQLDPPHPGGPLISRSLVSASNPKRASISTPVPK